MTSVGVGYSTRRRSAEAGSEATRMALDGLDGRPPDAILVFANRGYDQGSLLAAIREVAGSDAILCGCSSEGIIFHDGCTEHGCAVNVMAIASERIAFEAFNVPGLSRDPRACGAEIARRIAALGPERAKAAFVFPDGVTTSPVELLRSLDAGLAFPLAIAGGAAGAVFRRDADKLQVTHQYLGDAVASDSVSVLVAGGEVALDVAASHGCTPVGPTHRATADGRWLRRIDGRPAWEVAREHIDGELSGAADIRLCIGEPLAAGGDHLVHVALRLDDSGALLVPGGLQLGDEIQFMRRDPELIAAAAVQSARSLAGRHRGPPLAVFQFDSPGRGDRLFGEHTSRLAVRALQKAFPGTTPWIGFHTFGEIAQLDRATHSHNFTVVLCALHET